MPWLQPRTVCFCHRKAKRMQKRLTCLFSQSSGCFINFHSPSWIGLCQGLFCHPYCRLLYLCPDLALPRTEILASKVKKNPKLNPAYAFYLCTNLCLTIYYLYIHNLACKVEIKSHMYLYIQYVPVSTLSVF